MTFSLVHWLLHCFNVIQLALAQNLADVGQVGQVGIVKRVIVIGVLSVPILDDPLLEDAILVALAHVRHEHEIGHLSDQLCLFAADGRRQHRLLHVGLDEGRPAQE